MKRRSLIVSGVAAVAALLSDASPVLAQSYLGTNLRPYVVLGGTTVTCTGASVITGLVGVSPGNAPTGFPVPCAGVPVIPPASDPAQADLLTAYNTLDALSCSSTIGPDLAGLTLVSGVYCVTAAVTNLSGTVTLDAQGNGNALWVFQMSSSLNTSPNSVVSTINGGNSCGVQWLVRSSAVIDVNTSFRGNILALTSITLNNGANLIGRALARNGAVTMDTNNVSFAGCGAGAGDQPFFPGVPTLPHGMEWALLVILVGIGAYILSRR